MKVRTNQPSRGCGRRELARALTVGGISLLATLPPDARATVPGQEEPGTTVFVGVEVSAPEDDPGDLLTGFGKFTTRLRSPRQGRNPATGATITILRLPRAAGLASAVPEAPRAAPSKVSATFFVVRANGGRLKLGKVAARESNNGFTRKQKQLKGFTAEEDDQLEVRFNFAKTAPLSAGELFQATAFLRTDI